MGARTTLTQLPALEHPVLLKPMAGVSGGRQQCGGLALIGDGYGDEAWLAELTALCSGVPFGVDNFITECDTLLWQRRIHSSESL